MRQAYNVSAAVFFWGGEERVKVFKVLKVFRVFKVIKDFEGEVAGEIAGGDSGDWESGVASRTAEVP